MKKRSWLMLLVAAGMGGCQTHTYTGRGAAVGGLTGGGVGAAIGEIAADEPLVGAVVGSAVGALAGATVGSGLDEIDARSDARVQQVLYDRASAGTSLQEVLAMTDAGLSDQIISRHIREHGYSGRLSASDLISLRRQGVSEGVIETLQMSASESVRPAQAVNVAAPSPRVIVEERYHAIPVPLGPRPWHYRRACPPAYDPPGWHWGIAFGH